MKVHLQFQDMDSNIIKEAEVHIEDGDKVIVQCKNARIFRQIAEAGYFANLTKQFAEAKLLILPPEVDLKILKTMPPRPG